MQSVAISRISSALRRSGFFARNGRSEPSIDRLLRANLGTLNMDEVKRYFALFDRELLLDELLAGTTK